MIGERLADWLKDGTDSASDETELVSAAP
jgi:hypothetical protein